MNKCKYCTYSQGEYDPMKKVAFLSCDKNKEAVEPNDSCDSFLREIGSDDA